MADETVSISYQAFVRGIDQVQQLTLANQQLQGQIAKQTVATNNAVAAHDKHTSALMKANQAIRLVRREMSIFGFAAATLAGTVALLSKGSNDLASAMETLGRESARATQPVGDFLAKLTRYIGGKGFTAPALSIGNQARLASMFSEIEALKGNSRAAMIEKLRAEEITLSNQVGDKWSTIFKRVFEERKRLLLENLRLEELGLKRIEQIRKDFIKGIVGGAQNTSSDILYRFLQGEKQSPMDILKAFQSTFNKEIADYLTDMLFSKIFAKRDPVKESVDRANETLKDTHDTLKKVQECICNLASNSMKSSGASGLVDMIINPAKTSWLQKASAITGLIGSVSSASGMVSAAFSAGASAGGYAPGYSAKNPPVISSDVPLGHSGGFVGSFQSGGEVPIMAMPGEFVVRRSAAQANKDLLNSINSGGKGVPGTQNVFLIKTNDAQSFTAMLSSPSAQNQMEINLIRAIMNNGNIRNIIKNFAS